MNLDGNGPSGLSMRFHKALIYNDAMILFVKEDGRPLWDLPMGGMDYGSFVSTLKRELYEEVGYSNLLLSAFDVSDEIYIERIDANQICFSCRVWTENFDFSAGVDANVDVYGS